MFRKISKIGAVTLLPSDNCQLGLITVCRTLFHTYQSSFLGPDNSVGLVRRPQSYCTNTRRSRSGERKVNYVFLWHLVDRSALKCPTRTLNFNTSMSGVVGIAIIITFANLRATVERGLGDQMRRIPSEALITIPQTCMIIKNLPTALDAQGICHVSFFWPWGVLKGELVFCRMLITSKKVRRQIV